MTSQPTMPLPRPTALALVCITMLTVATPSWAEAPRALSFSGHLAGDAGALTGEVTVTVSLYDDPDSFAATHLLWSEPTSAFVSQGRFHVLLGVDPQNPLPDAVLEVGVLYVGVRIGDDDELRPRLRVASVPFALRAADAERLGGRTAEGFAPAGHGHGFDALSGQIAESQLPPQVTLDDEVALALQAKASADHQHDAAYVNEEQPGSVGGAMVRDGSLSLADLGDSGCGDGQIARWSSGSGGWLCDEDRDTASGPGPGLQLQGGVLQVDGAVIDAWARAACFDTDAELEAALAGRYAASGHLHDDRYPLVADVTAALAGKADAGHLHDDRYPLAADVTSALAGKADAAHEHDDRYYGKGESDTRLAAHVATALAPVTTALAGKADVGHLHDDRYPLATVVTTALAGKAALVHDHAAAYVDEGQVGAITTAMLANGAVGAEKLADVGCTAGQVLAWIASEGRWGCADDRLGLYSGADFALSSQACPFGQRVEAIDASGALVCGDDLVYGPGLGLVLTTSTLAVDRPLLEGWARAVCYDEEGELRAALDPRYAPLVHLHPAYATIADVNGALATKADVFHDHADLYYLKEESDHAFVNEGQADAISGGMIADGSVTLADLGPSSCARGQIPKRALGPDGSTEGWVCAPDDDTLYKPGAGLSLTDQRFDVVQGTIEGWARGVAYDTAAELKAAVPAWDQDHSNDLTTSTAFQGAVTGTYAALLLSNDVVTSAKIQNATIAPADLADGAVTSAAIANGAIQAVDLADGSVTSAIIQNGAVGFADLAANSVDSATIVNGSITAADLANNSVVSARILDGTIAAVDLATGAVTSTIIQNYTIAADDLADGAVGSNALAADSVTASELADGAVTSAAILNGTIGLADLAPNSVDSAAIVNGSITAADIATNSITSALLTDGTINAADLAGNSVVSAKILDGTIATADLANESVTSAIILNGTIVAADLANDSINSARIQNGTIVGADLANGTLTDAQVSASAAIAPAKIQGTAWTAANDGAGSGLDADLLDGQSSTAFAAASHTHATYWVNATATLRLTPSIAAPIACGAATAGTLALTDNYTLCICGLPPSGWGWVTVDGVTPCAW